MQRLIPLKGRPSVASTFAAVVLASSILPAPRVAAGPEPTPQRSLSQWIDQRLQTASRESGTGGSPTVDDATFLRRVYLDLVGSVPAISEVRDFISSAARDKRERIVERLIHDERFNEHFARVFRRVLMPPNTAQTPALVASLDSWLTAQFSASTPYDQIARRLVTAGGADPIVNRKMEATNPAIDLYVTEQSAVSPVAYLMSAGGQPPAMASSVSRVFLGVRLECAQCHDHPFTDWSQQDFWGVAAFFAGARLTPESASIRQRDTNQEPLLDERKSTITDEGGKTYSFGFPWTRREKVSIPEGKLPRQYFADWMTSPDNPQFSATVVNRIWQYLCGYGLTESVDDLDEASPQERAVILDDLAKKFAQGGFNIRELVQAICNSQAYQRPSDRSAKASSILQTRPLKVVTPEQLFDSLEIALALPISRIDQGPRYNGLRDQLVSRMEEALGERPDDFRSGIQQALKMMHGEITTEATDLDKSRTLRAVVDAPFLNLYEKIETLFLATLTRRPDGNELQRFVSYVQDQRSQADQGQAYAEIMWALINTPEFVLIR